MSNFFSQGDWLHGYYLISIIKYHITPFLLVVCMFLLWKNCIFCLIFTRVWLANLLNLHGMHVVKGIIDHSLIHILNFITTLFIWTFTFTFCEKNCIFLHNFTSFWTYNHLGLHSKVCCEAYLWLKGLIFMIFTSSPHKFDHNTFSLHNSHWKKKA